MADDDFYTVAGQLFTDIHTEFVNSTADSPKVIAHLLAVLLYRIRDYFWKEYNPIYEGNRSSDIVKAFLGATKSATNYGIFVNFDSAGG